MDKTVINRVTPRQLHSLLEEDTPAHVVDVRSSDEFATGHIPGANLIPLEQLSGHSLKKQLGNAAGHQLPIYLVCTTGIRAEKAYRRLHGLGLANTHLLDGGLGAWTSAGLPLNIRHQLPTPEQQVSILIGVAILFLVAKGFLITPWFYAVIAALGVGMIYSGFSGSCSLSGLLSRMPWNRNLHNEEATVSAANPSFETNRSTT